MSYTFRVVFDGVISYVPEKPFFVERRDKPRHWKAQEEEIRSVAVLLPDLRRPGTTQVPKPGKPVYLPRFRDPHFPILRFRLGDLRQETTRRVDLVCRDISSRDEDAMIFLRREQIRFDLESENTSRFTFANFVSPLDQEVPSSERDEMESLWWLPALDQLVDSEDKDAARICEKFLPSYRGPFPEGLIGRVECNGGRLRTFDFNRSAEGFPIGWRFASPGDARSTGRWNRAIGNSTALEFFDVRGDVQIEIKRLANEVISRKIVLGFSPGASRDILQIEISNREPDFLFEEEGLRRAVAPDMDFQAFYEKLSSVDPSRVASLPVPHPARKSFFGVYEKPCAGSWGLMPEEGEQ